MLLNTSHFEVKVGNEWKEAISFWIEGEEDSAVCYYRDDKKLVKFTEEDGYKIGKMECE